ncbi:MAG: hypothetical protein C0404_07515, partial [Verrucomicrobia bacterium]|nr:hypothetical protein [Verrucomicrobiota bacterium]
EIDRTLAAVDASQAANANKAGVKPVQHIRAYEQDITALRRTKRDLGKLENLVMAAGIDPGGLLGESGQMPDTSKRETELPPEKYRQMAWRVTVSNSSPTETRNIPISRNVPAEIKPVDIIDGGGLEWGTDPETGRCRVFKAGIELGPGKSTNFVVKIRDKWNINDARMEMMAANVSNLLEKISINEKYASIVEVVKGLRSELEAVRKEQGPRELSDKYVVFYRRQADRLDEIEQKLIRIDQLLRPQDKTTKVGFQAKPPSTKTTWLIIYTIIAFLFIMSLLFFFRWYGKSDAEKLEDGEKQ